MSKKRLSLKAATALILTAVMLFSAQLIPAEAVSYNMKSYLKAYKSGNFKKANKIAKKLPKKAKSYNKYMSKKMKKAYSKKVVGTKNISLYYLCDITGDKKPELFMQTGTCEADYRIKVYTYKKNKVKKIGSFFGGHSYLCDYPGKKAVLLAYGHMGSESLSVIKYKKGKLKAKHVNGRYSETDYTRVPYSLKYYYCFDGYNLSPFKTK